MYIYIYIQQCYFKWFRPGPAPGRGSYAQLRSCAPLPIQEIIDVGRGTADETATAKALDVH